MLFLGCLLILALIFSGNAEPSVEADPAHQEQHEIDEDEDIRGDREYKKPADGTCKCWGNRYHHLRFDFVHFL